MFKIIYRILIILLAASLIAAGLSWFAGTSAGQSVLFSSGGDFHAQPTLGQPSSSNAAQTAPLDFRASGDYDGAGGVNVSRALSDIPTKIGVIALITLLVAGTRKLIRILPGPRRPAPIPQA